MSAIRFYRPNDAQGFLSNFAPYPIALDGKEWPTSEHYFQAQKFLDEMFQEEIRSAPTPKESARLGRDRTKPLRADWELVKDSIMHKAVSAKFSQHPNLRRLLLATGPRTNIRVTSRHKDSVFDAIDVLDEQFRPRGSHGVPQGSFFLSFSWCTIAPAEIHNTTWHRRRRGSPS